jgi:ribosome biogenesis GTPase A
MIGAELGLCDVIIYMLDARCPRSCLNSNFREFTARKPVLFVLNKADLAPSGAIAAFRSEHRDFPVVALDSRESGSAKKVLLAVRTLLSDKISSAREKGVNKTIRAIIIGVTNCGKSTFINNVAGRGKTLTGDKPGVTRTKQWVTANLGGATDNAKFAPDVWLLDTPGVLPPSFDNPQTAKNLAYIGSIKDDILNLVDLARELVTDITKLDANCLSARFGASDFEGIARKRGYILKGNALDEERTAKALLVEFRAGKIGKFSLDKLFN